MAVPDSKNPNTAVRVQAGDTLSAIAKANNLTLSEIKALNPNIMNNAKYNNGNTIFSNTKINIAPPQPKPSPSLNVTPVQDTYVPTEETIIFSSSNLTQHH
jgi:LysM repeat protein